MGPYYYYFLDKITNFRTSTVTLIENDFNRIATYRFQNKPSKTTDLSLIQWFLDRL